ncbi:MAG: hypothetical protein GC204_01965 [Chloroflexi bacterium]|nr:hypothetical protein [Chloroflexota bacterium]
MMVDKERIHDAIDRLSPKNLEKVSEYIEALSQEEGQGSPWAKDFYDAFAPVRQEVIDKGMTEDEVNQIIDEAIEEVRRERKP